MSAYRNFDVALAEERAKRDEQVQVTLCAFRLGGEEFLITELPGTVFFHMASLDIGGEYDLTTPEGRAAADRDGAQLLAAVSGVLRDLLGERQFPRLVGAMGRARMDVPEMLGFVRWVLNQVVENATARPTELPSSSADAPSPTGSTSKPDSSSQDLTVPVS